MDNIVINICATERYTYALFTQARAIISNLSYFTPCEGEVILVTDSCHKAKLVADWYNEHLPPNWSARQVIVEADDSHKNYKESAQLLIGKMRQLGADEAKKINPDYYWSLDSDVIPKANSLQCMVDLLNFDKGYYEVAACPYPSQGGGPFMLGYGTPQRQILPNFYPEEKEVPKEILGRIKLLKKQVASEKNKDKRFSYIKRLNRWDLYIDKKCPPQGNIFEVTAKHGWKKRGWLDYAYPSLGKGAIIPSDWCGFGNTLLSKKALSVMDFSGYEGKGTEDLFIIWNRWHPAGIKIGGIPHCPGDHIIRRNGGYVHLFTYHEPSGEFSGHLRQRDVKWIDEDS